jgi:hypothetical protein
MSEVCYRQQFCTTKMPATLALNILSDVNLTEHRSDPVCVASPSKAGILRRKTASGFASKLHQHIPAFRRSLQLFLFMLSNCPCKLECLIFESQYFSERPNLLRADSDIKLNTTVVAMHYSAKPYKNTFCGHYQNSDTSYRIFYKVEM